MNEWISVKDGLPETCEDVYIKTDCDECPVLKAMHWKEGKFVLGVLMQCDKHYETDEKFGLISACTKEQLESYNDRITHWMSLPEPPEEK